MANDVALQTAEAHKAMRMFTVTFPLCQKQRRNTNRASTRVKPVPRPHEQAKTGLGVGMKALGCWGEGNLNGFAESE